MLARWFWLCFLLSVMTACGVAQTEVTVSGNLKGYFLTPDGTLRVREVPFSFPEVPSASDLPSTLHPLWAGYYLKATVKSKSLSKAYGFFLEMVGFYGVGIILKASQMQTFHTKMDGSELKGKKGFWFGF